MEITDEKLIKQLRLQSEHVPAFTIFDKAADRIEELVATNEQLGEELELAQGATNHWIISYLEVGVKLTKAVNVIKHILNIAPEGDADEWHIALDNATAMLAELGEN